MKMFSSLLFVSTLFTASLGNAQTRDLQWPELSAATCQLDAELSGWGVSFIYGGQVITGEGNIDCFNLDGQLTQSVPVDVEFYSAGFGFDFSYIKSVMVQSAAVRLTNGADDLMGSFTVGATAGANLIGAGIDFDAAIEIRREPGVSVSLAMSGREAVGLGVRLQAATMIISPK